MSTRAFWESDSMSPAPRPINCTPEDRSALDLQLSINQRLLDRVAELERKYEALEKKLKGVAASVPVY